MTRAAEGTKKLLMPLGATAGEDLRVVASPTERIKRSSQRLRWTTSVSGIRWQWCKPTACRHRRVIKVHRWPVLPWRQAIEATRYSKSAECVETLPLLGLLRAAATAKPVVTALTADRRRHRRGSTFSPGSCRLTSPRSGPTRTP